MKIVMAAAGSRGDVMAFAALAEQLLGRGHDVTFLTHASLAGLAPAGADVAAVPSDPHLLLSGPAGRALRRGDPRALNNARNHFADFLRSFDGPTDDALRAADVLVASTFAVASVDAAFARGVPVVRGHLWPEFDTLDGPMPLLPYAWRLPPAARRVARGALRRVEPYFAGVEGGYHDGRLDLSAHHPVGLTATSLGALHGYSPVVEPPVTSTDTDDDGRTVVTGWWRTADARSLSSRTQELLASGDPWVAVGFGSMHQSDPARLVDVISRACRQAGVRALLQLDDAPMDPSGTVVSIGDEPHEALFARVRAVVHHGGSGTTGSVARVGVPSVTVPHFADQFHWGHRMAALGAAPAPLPRRLLSSRLLSGRLRHALASDTASRAADVGRHVRAENGAATAALALERLTAAAGV